MDPEDYTLPSATPDLGLVPVEALIEELSKRSHTCVVLRHSQDEGRGSGEGTYTGCYYTAIGLLESYKNDLIHIDLENAPRFGDADGP